MEGGREALIDGQTEECEGSIKIIKISFPANMQAAHEQTLKALLREKSCAVIVQMGFSCLLKSSSSQVLWLWRDLCRCTVTYTPRIFALFFVTFLLQGIFRIWILWAVFLAGWCSTQLALCLYFGFFEMVSLLTSDMIHVLYHRILRLPKTPWLLT